MRTSYIGLFPKINFAFGKKLLSNIKLLCIVIGLHLHSVVPERLCSYCQYSN